MRWITARVIVTTLVVTFGALLAVVPGARAADLDATRDAVWDVVWEADAANQLIINTFVNAGIAAQTMAQLVSARDQANTSLDSVWYSSVAQLEDLHALFPVELADDVASAMSRLLRDHDDAHDEIAGVFDDLSGALPPPGSTTTTTTPASTTTTTTTTTSTTATATTSSTSSTSTTTTLPATTTTTRVSTTTTTSPAATTTRPPTAGGTATPPSTPDPTVQAGSSAGDTIMSMELLIGMGDTAYDLPGIGGASPPAGEASGPVATRSNGTDAMGGASPVSSMMVEIGETIQVPDRVIQFTVAPIVFVEVLLGILFESLEALVVPVAILITAVAIFVWRERRRPFDVGLAQPPM